jgi:ABC-type multidrug transport system fused ATPase/permease subunit
MKKSKNKASFKTVLKLFALFKGHSKALFLGLFLLFTTTLFTLLPPVLIKQAVDTIKTSQADILFYTFLLIIVATIVKGFFYYGQRILMENTGQKNCA